MTEKNHISMGLKGRAIDIHITATSEEQARKMYEAIERSLIEAIRIDLESEWSRDDDGGDP
jgi:tRNA threonylcarbamoyladenosine modification (KEOPS) complex  Pcc1 subunit